MTYVLDRPYQGYDAGAELRDLTLDEARALECNRCGGCCSGLLPDDTVKKDPDTGLPLFVWGTQFPDDLYAARYGKPMLLPIVPLQEIEELPYQGGIGLGDRFIDDENGKPYTCYSCAFHSMDGEKAVCELREKFPNPDPEKLEEIRPRNCGEFPIFSTAVDDTIIAGHAFIPATGSLPRCTWHGIRIVGPWKRGRRWRERWERQQLGLEVDDLSLPADWVEAMAAKTQARRETADGSVRKSD